SELVGRLLWESFPDIAGTVFESEARIAMEGTLPRVFEAWSSVLGRWFEVRAFPCQQGLAALFIDITERRADAVTRADLERQPLRPLIEDSLRLLHTTLPANVQLRQQLTDEPLAATFNPAEVQQVVMNLCTNAWHALGPDGGTIVVELRARELDTAISADVG